MNDQTHTTLHHNRTNLKLYPQSDLNKKEQQLQNQLETRKSPQQDDLVKEPSRISEERYTTTLRSNQQEIQRLEQQQPQKYKQHQ